MESAKSKSSKISNSVVYKIQKPRVNLGLEIEFLSAAQKRILRGTKM